MQQKKRDEWNDCFCFLCDNWTPVICHLTDWLASAVSVAAQYSPTNYSNLCELLNSQAKFGICSLYYVLKK